MKKLVIIIALPLLACATGKSTGGGSSTGSGPVKGTTVTEDGLVKPPEISNRAKLLFEDATRAFEAQQKAGAFDYGSLERKFQAAVDADPNLAEARYNLGVIAERQGKTDEAIAHYRAALKVKPRLKQAAENLGVIAQNQGDLGAAVQIYRDTLELHPDDASSRARLAEVYRRQSDHDKAMELAREALLREPKTLAAYKVMMRSYLDRRQLSMAKLVALRAIKLDDKDPELHHTVGLILLAEKETDAARVEFMKAVEVQPDYVPAHVELAQLCMKFEDYQGAETHLRRILQSNGKNAEAHLLLGVAYKGMGQYDKAMVSYDEAEKLNPNLAAVHLNRAILLHRHKDAPERAVELYKKYLSLAGEGVVDAESPVLALVREAEAVVAAKREAAAMEEQMRREQAAQQGIQGPPAEPGGNVQPAGGEAPPEAQPAAATEAPAPDPEEPSDDFSDEPSDDL